MLYIAACLIVENGKLLLLKRFDGIMEPPGGKVNTGETTEQAAAREAKEELGIDVAIVSFFSIHFIKDAQIYMFVCRRVSGEPRCIEKEKYPEFGWYALVDLERFAQDGVLAPNMQEVLPRMRELL